MVTVVDATVLDGLTYVTQRGMQLLEPALRATVLQLKGLGHTFGATVTPGLLPDPGQTAWDALVGWKDLGYVVMVNKSNPIDFLISESGNDVAKYSKENGTHAIMMGPETLLRAATVISEKTWVLPAVLVAGLVFYALYR